MGTHTLTLKQEERRFLPHLKVEVSTPDLSDDTVGNLWECRPLSFLSDKSAEYLSGILSQEYPKSTVISFMLYPDDRIDPFVDSFDILPRLKSGDSYGAHSGLMLE